MDEFSLFNIVEEGASLWDVDLGLTVLQVDVYGVTLHSLAISGWVEDVANLLAISESSVWHLDVLVIVRVGRGDKELASLESVEVILDIPFFEWMVPDRHVLSSAVDRSRHLVDV